MQMYKTLFYSGFFKFFFMHIKQQEINSISKVKLTTSQNHLLKPQSVSSYQQLRGSKSGERYDFKSLLCGQKTLWVSHKY